MQVEVSERRRTKVFSEAGVGSWVCETASRAGCLGTGEALLRR